MYADFMLRDAKKTEEISICLNQYCNMYYMVQAHWFVLETWGRFPDIPYSCLVYLAVWHIVYILVKYCNTPVHWGGRMLYIYTSWCAPELPTFS